MACIHVALRPYAAMDAVGMAALLAPDDQQRLASDPGLRHRQMLAIAYRRQVLAAATGTEPQALRMLVAESGKPWLPDHPLSFNVSHTRTACVVAWCADGIALGVDIEDRTRRPRMAEIAAEIFSAGELARWQQSAHAPETWLAIWTRKEALLKCCGTGLGADPAKTDSGSSELRHSVAHPEFGSVTVQSLRLGDHVLALAWQSDRAATTIILDAGRRAQSLSLLLSAADSAATAQ